MLGGQRTTKPEFVLFPDHIYRYRYRQTKIVSNPPLGTRDTTWSHEPTDSGCTDDETSVQHIRSWNGREEGNCVRERRAVDGRPHRASRSRTESSTSAGSPPPAPPPLHVAPCLCLFVLNLDYGSDCTCLPLPSRIARVSNAVTVADAIAASPNRPRTK